ncbi:MAG: VWA domain-containing protein, partial [Armatimonadetes bacterium]|nr:VWA domain-containing protein [Armatimonadota bacterium]
VVLLSDGNENLGDALAEARRTAALGIAIDVRPLRLPPRGEVLAERLTVPAETRRGDTFEPRLTIRSDTTTTARLRLLQGNVQVAQMTTPVAPGKSVVALPPVTIHDEGFHHFVVVVEPQADADLRNNRALGFTLVRGRQRVLYVEGDQGQERYLRAALAGSGLELTTVGPAGLPTALPGLVPYDCLILSNVSAVDLSETQLVMIRSAVRDLGMGLVMIGGDQSFGVGGYYQTPVEEALPVDMDVRKLRHLPNVGVAVVIDKSGSMAMTEGGLEKIQLANEAAIALVSLLDPSDQVAVIPTDSEAKPATGPTMMPVAQKQMVVDMIARIRAGGGGIYCYNGLKRAAELLHSASTALKHIILFADAADSEQQERCRELVASLSRRKVTTSVVALGRASDSDVKFLKDIARLGQGRFYLTHQASRLPRIFTREAILASRSQVVEKRFTPRLLTDLEVLKGIAQLPALRGYVATTAKPTAEVGLVTADRHQDPILASWHYGLGRSVAFTSDCKARWAVDWLGWPGYARFWSQVVRWTIRRARRGQFESRVVSGYGSDPDEVEADGPARGEARLLIDAVDEQGRFVNGLRFHGSAVAPDGSGLELDLRQRGPGRYEATFPTHQVGTYLVNVASGEGATQGSQTIGTSLAWPPEYGATRSNEALLQRLAETANGAVLHDPREVFVPKGPPARATRDIWTWLLAFAVALFPLDVAVRRV